MGTTAADVLAGMTATLADPSRWTKGAPARDAAGEPCPSTDPRAVCWCIYGARRVELTKIVDLTERDALDDETDEALHEAAGHATPSAINDGQSTTHAEILDLVGRARAWAEAHALTYSSVNASTKAFL